MARLTKVLGNQEGYWVDIAAIEKIKDGFTGEAIAKLAILENILDDLTANQAELTEQLDRLREEDKTKTVRFKEMMGQKLMNNMMITHFKKYGLE